MKLAVRVSQQTSIVANGDLVSGADQTREAMASGQVTYSNERAAVTGRQITRLGVSLHVAASRHLARSRHVRACRRIGEATLPFSDGLCNTIARMTLRLLPIGFGTSGSAAWFDE